MIYYKSGIPFSLNMDLLKASIESAVNELRADGCKIYLELRSTQFEFNSSPTLSFLHMYINDKKLQNVPNIYWYGETFNSAYSPSVNSTDVMNYHLFICDTIGSECFILLLDAGSGGNVKEKNLYIKTAFGNQYTFGSLAYNIICFTEGEKLVCHNNEYPYFLDLSFSEMSFTSGMHLALSNIYNMPFGCYTDPYTDNEKIYIEKLCYNISPLLHTEFGGYGEADSLYVSVNNKKVGFGTIVSDGVNKYVNCIAGYYLLYSEKLFLPSEYDGEVGPIKEEVDGSLLLNYGFVGGYSARCSSDGAGGCYYCLKDSSEKIIDENSPIIGGMIMGRFIDKNLEDNYPYLKRYQKFLDTEGSLMFSSFNQSVWVDNKAKLLFIASPKRERIEKTIYIKYIRYNNSTPPSTYLSYSNQNVLYSNGIYEYNKDGEIWYYTFLRDNNNWSYTDSVLDSSILNNNQFNYYHGLKTCHLDYYINDTYNITDDLHSLAKNFINKFYKQDINKTQVSELFNFRKTIHSLSTPQQHMGYDVYVFLGDCIGLIKNGKLYLYGNNYCPTSYGIENKNWWCSIGSDKIDVTNLSEIKLKVKFNFDNAKNTFFDFYTYYSPNNDTASHGEYGVLSHDISSTIKAPDNLVTIRQDEEDTQEILLDVSKINGFQRIFIRMGLNWDGVSESWGFGDDTPDMCPLCEISDIEFIEK